MSIAIDFEWQRDESGYDWDRHPLPDPRIISVPVIRITPGMSEAEKKTRFGAVKAGSNEVKNLPGGLIRRRGGNLVNYRPLERYEGLFRVFAGGAQTAEGLLDFVRRFGPLTNAGNSDEGENIRFGLVHALRMNELLGATPEYRLVLLKDPGDHLRWAADISLGVNQGTGTPQLYYKVGSLINALWLELGQAISTGRDLRRCLLCGGWFETGPGTTRRADAKFCSDDHRIAYNSQKRTQRPA